MRAGKINRLNYVLIAAVLGAAIAFVTVQLARPDGRVSVGHAAIQGPPGPTVAQPLANAKQTTMAAAESALGVSVPLPNTSLVSPAEAGAVWEGTTDGGTTMAITFPSQGIVVGYNRPSALTDPAQAYQQDAVQIPSAKFVELNGATPALVIAQNSDDTGANFGVVAFVVNGTEVRVMGHTDEAALEAIAQSLLARWPSTTSSPSGTSSSPAG